MSYTELPLIDYIDIDDEQVHLLIHTKDKRIISLRDVVSNLIISDGVVSVEHMSLEQRLTLCMSEQDFSHIEYYYAPRPFDSKKAFDDLNSFIEEQIQDLEDPPEVLREP